MKLLRATALAISLLSLPVLAKDPESAAPVKVTSIEGITEYRLDNGLRVLLFPDASRPIVTVNLTVMVGSRHEGYGETGMAHLLEHMLFKGSPAFPDVPKALRDHGAQFNGTTWLDRTNYFETMPASDENLEFGIQLEADRLVNSFVRRDDLISEMTVVRNEFESGENDPERILLQRVVATAFEWHNYGKSTIGNRSDIERVPIENLQAFYRKFYQPDNAMIVIAGKFDEKKALELVGKYFGPLKKPARRFTDTYTEEPPQDGERFVTLRRVGSVGAALAVYHIPAAAHADFPAIEVLAGVLGTEPSGRLYKALVETKLASKTQSLAFGAHDPSLIGVGATCAPKSIDAVRERLVATMEDLAKNPVSAEEVDRAKVQLKKEREELFSDSAKVAVHLSEWASKGDWRLFFVHRDRLDKVTAADVNRVAATYLLSSNRTLGMFVPTPSPTRAAVPATPSVAKLVEGYLGGKAIAAGEAFDPTPANLDARLQTSTIGPMKIGLLPKKTRGERALVQIALRFGNEQSLAGMKTTIDMMADMLERGTKNHTRQQFKDKLDKLKAELTITSEVGIVLVGVKAPRGNLSEALSLVTEMLREPAFPAKELDLLKAELLERLDKMRSEPTGLGIREMQRRMTPYPKDHPLHIPTIEEEMAQIQAATLEQITSVYKQVSAQNGEVAVIGDFDADSTMKQLATTFEGWTATVPHRRISRLAHPKLPGSKTDINTPDKANAFYVAGLSFEVGDAHPDAVAIEMGNYLLGGAPLASRLSKRVRGKDGLSYMVQSVAQSSPRDPATRFLTYAICNPKNIDKVSDGIADEINQFLDSGPSLTELMDARKGFLEGKKVARSDDDKLAMQIVNNLSLNRTFAFEAGQEKKAEALQPDEIKDAFKRHVDPKKLIIIRAGDFGKK